MRPNLMSPKRARTSGEDSILAMLERDPARKRGTGGGASRARLAWYGGSAAVAIALTGTLVWLAAGNDGLRPDVERSMMADAGRAAPPVALAQQPAPALVQVALAETAPAAGSGSAAVIVDQKPQDDVPPLRLLKPAPGTPAKTPAPPAAAPAKPAPKAVAPAPAAAPPARTPTASAAAAPRPRPVTAARNAPRPAPAKPQRQGVPARAAEAPVDPDVALISAVIVHANGHAQESSQMTELLCPNDSCQARPKSQ